MSKYHTYTPRTSVNCKVLEYGEYIAPVASVLDLRRQVDAIDRQTVELLSRRNALVKQITSQLDEDEPDKAREAQVLSNWLEEGFDYDLDEVQLERVCKTVMEMGRKAKDA